MKWETEYQAGNGERYIFRNYKLVGRKWGTKKWGLLTKKGHVYT